MTKEPAKESIVDKIKADEAAKAAEAEKARIAAEQAKDDPTADEGPKDSDLAKAAEAEKARIAAAERDENDAPIDEGPHQANTAGRDDNIRHARGRKSAEKLRLIALSYPLTTPDEHIIFGFGGYKYTLGDLRDLTNVR